MTFDPLALLWRMFEGVQPSHCLPPHLPDAPKGRLIVLGGGKASAAMARMVEDHWRGEISGLVVTRYGYGVPCDRIEIMEAAHPVPAVAGRPAHSRHRGIGGLWRHRPAPDIRRRFVALGASPRRVSLSRTSRRSTGPCRDLEQPFRK